MDIDGPIHNNIENNSAVNEQNTLTEKTDVFNDVINLLTLNSKGKPENQENVSFDKKLLTLIKSENLQMISLILDKEELFKNLDNELRFLITEHLSQEKTFGQEYINKILKNSDDELILLIAKNKEIYNNLNRNNRFIIIERLLSSPWITTEETKKVIGFSEFENKIDLEKKSQKKVFKNILKHDSVKNFFMNKRTDNFDLLGEL
jgi:hypothetical protein